MGLLLLLLHTPFTSLPRFRFRSLPSATVQVRSISSLGLSSNPSPGGSSEAGKEWETESYEQPNSPGGLGFQGATSSGGGASSGLGFQGVTSSSSSGLGLAGSTSSPSPTASPSSPPPPPPQSPSGAGFPQQQQRTTLRPRPMSEMEHACRQILSRRNPSEPIETTLSKAQFPLTTQNLALVLSHLRSPRDALRLFLCFIRENPNFVPEKALLDALSRFWRHEKDRFSVFLSILHDMRSPNVSMTPRRLTSLIRGYGWAGLVEDVLHFFTSCKVTYGFNPDFIHYSCALHTCVQEKRLDIALQIFEQMKKDGKPPTYDTFQSLITGLLDAYKPRDAAMLFEQMLASNLVKPSELPSRVVSYVTIVNELLSSEDFEGVHTFVMMLNENGFNADYITCANILKALSRKGQVQALDDVFDEMKSKGLLPDVVKLKELVNHHCKGLVTAESQKLLTALSSTIDSIAYFKTSEGEKSVEGMPSAEFTESEAPSLSGMELNNGPDFVLFDQIIRSLCVYEKPEDAYQLMLKMNEYGESLSATTSMILFDAICWASKWEEAEFALRKMMQKGHLPDLKVYNSWIQGSCKADRLENITNFLDEFGHGDLVLDALSYNVAVEKLCMAGKLDEAKKITNETKRNLGTPDVVIYSRMIQSFAKAGDFEVPRKLLEEMIELGITPFALPFTPLVQKLCISGKMDEAVALVDEIEAKGCKPLSSLYTIIVSAYCKAQRLNDAFNLTDIMKAKGITPETQIHKELFGSCMGTRTLKPAVKVQ